MSDLRAALAEELSAKVKKHGIVVWDDPAREYVAVAAEVAPSDAVFERWDGSYYRLRRSVEPPLSGGSPPRLVIYLPCPSPADDPLAEARDAGSVFTRRLNTLVERALKGRLTSARIDQIGRQAETIEQAEAVLEGSDQGADARLVAAIGASSPSEMVRRLLTPAFDYVLDEGDLWESAARFLANATGTSASGKFGDDLRRDVFRDMVLRILDAATGDLPDSLPAIETPATTRQLRIGEEAIALLRNGPDADQYRRLARDVDVQLGLSSRLQWDRRLANCDITPAVDEIAFDAAIGMLEATRHQEAGDLASTRLASSWWARPGRSGETGAEAKWRAVAALADLHDTARARPTGMRSLANLLDWYVEVGWRVDAAHRRVESLRAVLPIDTDSLDRAFQEARAVYEKWLEDVLVAVSAAGGADPGTNISSQREIHRHVESSDGPTVFVWVDALRYELGQALVERLRQLPATVDIRPAVATPPTVTPVGMASLLPDAAVHMSLVLSGNKVRVKFRDDDVKSVSDRVAQLEQRHGTVANLRLTDAVQRGNDWLRSQVESSDLVLVRSQEIDQSGESDLLACTWGDFENVLTVLTTLIARFLHIGVRTVVVAADHGFLALSRELGTDRLVDPPATGTGELHRRAWIGIGGTVTDATVKVPIASFGVRSDLDLIIPKGLGVFRAGGGLQFFHGGLSPQELIVPVVTVTAHTTPTEPARSITARLSGSRITTGIVVITTEVEGEPDLFGTTSRVRVQLTDGNEPCSRLIGGDDVDPATGTVEVTTQQPRVVTLQITRDLQAGTNLNLDVIDAATGARLSRSPVEVAADVRVEDDLG